MKGADQCPRCGSRKTADVSVAGVEQAFYAATLRVCSNCGAAWEPFDEADLLDAGARYSSFREPCSNCAFRKGSPEQSDPQRWAELMESLGWTGGRFYCHKGVPIDIKSEDGFAYPVKRQYPKKPAKISEDLAGPYEATVDVPDTKRLRLCRGFLNWLNSAARAGEARGGDGS